MTAPDLYTVHFSGGMIAYNADEDLVVRWKSKGLDIIAAKQFGIVYPNAPYDRAYGELGAIDTGEEGQS